MGIGDLPNPREAHKLIRSVVGRFHEEQCMAPTRDCEGPIIAAHTLSCEATLRPMSREGHVYTVHNNPYAEINEITSIRRTGIKDATTFNGFCQKHDREIFSPIEKRPFVCAHEQVFLHGFRAVAKESFLKRRQAETIPTPESISKIHNLDEDNQFQMSEDGNIYRGYSFEGANDIDHLKRELDKIYIHKEWRRLYSTIIPFKKCPPVACNFVFSPDFDYAGNELQDFQDTSSPLEMIMVTITAGHGEGGFAILSHLDTANSASSAFVKSLIVQPDLSSALTWMVIRRTETLHSHHCGMSRLMHNRRRLSCGSLCKRWALPLT